MLSLVELSAPECEEDLSLRSCKLNETPPSEGVVCLFKLAPLKFLPTSPCYVKRENLGLKKIHLFKENLVDFTVELFGFFSGAGFPNKTLFNHLDAPIETLLLGNTIGLVYEENLNESLTKLKCRKILLLPQLIYKTQNSYNITPFNRNFQDESRS